MTVSRTKLERPATFGDLTLSVDGLFQPTRVSAGRVNGRDRTIQEVATRAYDEVVNVDDLVEWLGGTVGFPSGGARALGVQLAEKMHAATLRA
jgi:hypothetical protein